MKIVEIRNMKGNWNEKFYGKEKNIIYLNNEKIELTEEEIKEIQEQKYKEYSNKEEIVEYKESVRKVEIITNYLQEIASLVDEKETIRLFTIVRDEMVQILKNKTNN